jgi:hypothetical protein
MFLLSWLGCPDLHRMTDPAFDSQSSMRLTKHCIETVAWRSSARKDRPMTGISGTPHCRQTPSATPSRPNVRGSACEAAGSLSQHHSPIRKANRESSGGALGFSFPVLRLVSLHSCPNRANWAQVPRSAIAGDVDCRIHFCDYRLPRCTLASSRACHRSRPNSS